jgi:HNH endonuclease
MSNDNSTAEVEYHDVIGWPGYRVGDDGSVWSRRRRGGGRIDHESRPLADEWHRIKATLRYDGYRYVQLSVAGRSWQIGVRLLVLQTFVGPRPPGMECRHLNSDRTDDRLANLGWGTVHQNAADRIKNGTQSCGEAHPSAKLDEPRVREILGSHRAGISIGELSRRYRVARATIRKIVRGRAWKHVSARRLE